LFLDLASAVILRSESLGTNDHILLSQIRDSPNLEGQVPVFISPRNRVARLYPQAPGSRFVASYDSQGYGGGTRLHLHTGRQILIFDHMYIHNKAYFTQGDTFSAYFPNFTKIEVFLCDYHALRLSAFPPLSNSDSLNQSL
jgi:hypothetical protein